MDKDLLDITAFEAVGFKPLILFKSWRVATLCYGEDLHPRHAGYLERHMETDEVFILMRGQATLMLGGAGASVDQIEAVAMQPLQAYNVKLGAWHGVLMSRDAIIALVENVDTGQANSEYFNLTPAQKETFVQEARKFPDWQAL